MVDNDFSFERAMQELEEIVRTLESGDVSLDESLKLYEKGVGLVREANRLLADAKEKIVSVSDICKNDV